MAGIEDRPFDVLAAVARLRTLIDRHCLGPSTACIVDAADDRDIPYIRLFEGNRCSSATARASRIWTAETDRTSAIAEGISRDKDLTKELLSTCGVPVPEGRRSTAPRTPGTRPRTSACRWWSSPMTATTAAASSPT